MTRKKEYSKVDAQFGDFIRTYRKSQSYGASINNFLNYANSVLITPDGSDWVSPAYWRNIEAGDNQITLPYLIKLADILEIDPQTLFTQYLHIYRQTALN